MSPWPSMAGPFRLFENSMDAPTGNRDIDRGKHTTNRSDPSVWSSSDCRRSIVASQSHR